MARIALASALLLGFCIPAFAVPPEPKVTSATDGVFEAFQNHALVGLGEWHGLAQMYDFYVQLLRDPRFAKNVGNVVMEMGGASEQAIVDRYVNGEQVPYTELRKVWADSVASFPTVTASGSINIYSTIRDVNAKLPPEQRIKVWLGQPPFNWDVIKTRADWDRIGNPLVEQRDTYTAQLIGRELLEKNRKALVIYGAGHLVDEARPGGEPNIRMLIDAKFPGALFVVTPYVGYAQKDCATRFESHIKDWPTPALAAPIRGSALEKDIWSEGCGAFAKPDGLPQAKFDASNRANLGLTSDALLYLGPRKSLVTGPRDLDIILDLQFRAEINRRALLRTGKEMAAPNTAGNVPRPFIQD